MKNGLYSIHVSLQDGRAGKGSGVVMFRDGKILGGDAYLFYTGTYTTKGDSFKGEVLVQRLPVAPMSIRCSAVRVRSASGCPAPSPIPRALWMAPRWWARPARYSPRLCVNWPT